MIALLIVAFFGWIIWVTGALSQNGRAVNELRQEIETLKARLNAPADQPERVDAAEPLPTEEAVWVAPNAADALAEEPVMAEPWPTEVVSDEAILEEAGPEEPAFAEAPAERPARRQRRPAPTLDWERAWQSVAGPLSGGRGNGSAGDIGGAEARLGTLWLSRIGVVLLLIGAVFAYRFGVTANVHRLIIGYAVGIGLLALGYWGQRRQYRIWAQAITGGGLGLLYLTTTAGSALFSPAIIPQPVGFALMGLTTALGTGLAVYYGAQVVGLLSLIGGFATPFLLSTGGGGDFRLLFAYIAILDAGLLLVAYFRRWPLYNYLVFLATWGIFGAWRFIFAQPADWQWAMAAASAYFVIFALVSVAHGLIRRLASRPADLLLTVINGAVYFGLGLTLIAPLYTVLRGFFAFGVAAVYLALGAATARQNRNDRLMVYAFLGLAAVFLTIAFPVALNGSWNTAAWALQGALMVWLGFASGYGGICQGGLAVLGLAAVRLAVWDTFPGRFGLPLLAPELRGFTFLTVVVACYLAAWAYSRFRGGTGVRNGLAIAGNFFTLWYVSMEVILRYQGVRPLGEAYGSCGMTIAAVWAAYGLLLALTDYRWSYAGVRQGARVILGLALIVMAVSGARFDIPEVMGYLGLGITLASVWLAELSFRLRGANAHNGALSLAANVVAFAALGLQVNRVLSIRFVAPLGESLTPAILATQYSTRLFVVAAALAGYALLSMIAGMALRSASARGLAGIYSALLAAAAAYSALHPETSWQVRAMAFALIVLGACLIAWLSGRVKDARPAWERGVAGLPGLAAAALTAWWGMTQILRAPSGYLYWFDGPRLNLVLIWLGGYALALGAAGVWLRARLVRGLAAVIQWIALVLLLAVSASITTPWGTLIGALATVILGIYAANLLHRSRSADRGENREGLALGLAACVATVIWAGCAIYRLFMVDYLAPTAAQLAMASARNHWILIVAGLYALLTMLVGSKLKSGATRTVGFIIQALAIAGTMTVGLSNLNAGLGLRLAAFAACVGGAYAGSFVAERLRDGLSSLEHRATETLSLAAAALTVVWLALQISQYFAPFVAGGTAAERALAASASDFGISAGWGVYGLIVLITGFVLRHRWTRLLGLLTLALTLGKIGIFDMWQLAVNWRILITIGLGVIFVAASLMYQRFIRVILGDDRRSEPMTSGRNEGDA